MRIISFNNFPCNNAKKYVTLQFYKISAMISKQIFVFLCISLCSLSLCDNNLVTGLKAKNTFNLNEVAINTSQILVVKNLQSHVNGTIVVPCKKESQNQNRSCETMRNINMNKDSEQNFTLNRKSAPVMLPPLEDETHNKEIYYPTTKRRKKRRKSKGRRKKDRINSFSEERRYNFGKGLNISLDMQKDIVNVNLDEDNLREVLNGFPYEVTDEEGRKKHHDKGDKNYDMMSKVLPLFLLPFLIQSAIIPFIVTKLKLLLIKSILIGKLAIFLIVISAIKNSQQMASHEPPPSYFAWKTEHKSEILPGYKYEDNPYKRSTK